jgi:hypothetical protein
VKFLVLLTEEEHFERWDSADDTYRERCFDDYRAFAEAVRQRGTIVTGDALVHPQHARTLRPGEGRPVIEGPYAETVEQLGGFYLIDVPDLDTAVELAKLLPREYTIEVRATLEVEV